MSADIGKALTRTQPVKLFYSANSPYARIARIAALESGLPNIEMIRVQTRTPASPILRFSPVGRVPTLVDRGLVLGEARSVWRYLKNSARPSVPDAGRAASWEEISHEAMVEGFLDGIASWVRECRRQPEERSGFLIEVERQRAARCLAFFEARIETIVAKPWDFAQVALACALDLMDCYGLVEEWEMSHHGLFLWLDEQRGRPAMRATKPCN